MPMFRPKTDRIGHTVLETKGSCPSCPDAWLYSGFGETDVQGLVIEGDDGVFRYTNMPETEARQLYPNERIFVVGRDGYYLTLEQSRQAIDADAIRAVHYVDDYNDEYQDFYVCDPSSFPFNVPGEEARQAEPIR